MAPSQNKIQIYPSSIFPPGNRIEYIKKNQLVVSSMFIEVLHILCFITIVAFITGRFQRFFTANPNKQLKTGVGAQAPSEEGFRPIKVEVGGIDGYQDEAAS